jgi:hypothetical protein
MHETQRLQPTGALGFATQPTIPNNTVACARCEIRANVAAVISRTVRNRVRALRDVGVLKWGMGSVVGAPSTLPSRE